VTIELSPRLPDGQRPSGYASLAAEQVDLENVINDLVLRLEDHKYRWELYEFGLTDATETRPNFHACEASPGGIGGSYQCARGDRLDPEIRVADVIAAA
jgi:hypothetical protein